MNITKQEYEDYWKKKHKENIKKMKSWSKYKLIRTITDLQKEL